MAEFKHGGKREGAGRPKGSVKENKKNYKTFSVACLDEEFNLITELAKKNELTKSRFIVECVKFYNEANK